MPEGPSERVGVTTWLAIVLGVTGCVLLAGVLNGWFLPRAGMLEAILIGVLSAIATALAVTSLVRGGRRPVNWIALVVAAPPVVFLIIFGLGSLLGPSY